MTDSDTEFVTEDKSVISTSIIRKEEIGDQNSSASVPEASIHILPTKTRIKPVLQVRMNRILLLPLNVLPINHLLLPLNVLLIGHLMLLLLDVLLIIHQNLILLLKLLYPKTPRNRIKSRRAKTKRKRKRLMLHPTRTTQGRKRAVSRLTKTKQRTKKPVRPRNEIGTIKKSL